ncbi:cytochrome c [Vasconcelosia minhoensis]|uniref:cytochrome c n=1 Tax=Vasconcelosia minhoensis TaxID=3366354 RepID=UPI002AD30756|nr:cytochrome c [Romeria gracilis]
MTQETLEKEAEVSSGVHLLQQIGLLLLSLVLAVGLITWGMRALRAADPYMQSVLSTAGNAARGEEIFKLNCATCHGLEASGEVGPNLHGVSDRKSRVALINQVISGNTPPMPQFQPTAKDMADLLEFLETL